MKLPEEIWEHIFEFNVNHRILYKNCMSELMKNPWKDFDYLIVHGILIDSFKKINNKKYTYINSWNFTLKTNIYSSLINNPSILIQKTGFIVHRKNEKTDLRILYGWGRFNTKLGIIDIILGIDNNYYTMCLSCFHKNKYVFDGRDKKSLKHIC